MNKKPPSQIDNLRLTPWDVTDHLQTAEEIASYMDACRTENDPALMEAALTDAARARARWAIPDGANAEATPGHRDTGGNDMTHQNAGDTELVFKGWESIQYIHSRFDKTVDASILTWQVSRLIRRDFYPMSNRLFFLCKQSRRLPLIRQMLLDVEAEAQRLTDIAHKYEMPAAEPVVRLSIRLVSEETERLLAALMAADRALYKLSKSSEMAELADFNYGPFCGAVSRLKLWMMHQKKRSENVQHRTLDLEKVLKPRSEDEIRREIELKAKARFSRS